MQLFPKSHKRKKTNVPLKVLIDGEPTLVYRKLVGIERTPFVIHRKVTIKEGNTESFTVSRNQWTVTHLFSGLAVGIYGTFQFCSAVANGLLEQPVFYLPTESMMSAHPDFNNAYYLIEDLKEKYKDLNG